MFFSKWKRRFRHLAHSRTVFCSRDMLLCTAVMIVTITMVSGFAFVVFQDTGGEVRCALGICVSNAHVVQTIPSSKEAPVAHTEQTILSEEGHVANDMIKAIRKYPRHIPVDHQQHAEPCPGSRRTNSSLSPEDIACFEKEQSIRQKQMRATCRRYDLDRHDSDDSLHRLNAFEYLVDRQHKIVWCTIFKAASSSWFYMFNLLAGYSPSALKSNRKTPMELARAKFPRPNEQQLRNALQDSISFLVVREPFERLLSAFRDKYEFMRHKFYKKVSLMIVARYRKPSKNDGDIPPGPTFPEFVRYVIDTAKSNGPFNEHWAPYYRFCTPCLLNFTVIAHLETNPLDSDYILHRAKLDDVDMKRPTINPAKGDATHDVVDKYYGQLDLPLLQELYSVYRIDFEMFGYNATKYFDIVKRRSG